MLDKDESSRSKSIEPSYSRNVFGCLNSSACHLATVIPFLVVRTGLAKPPQTPMTVADFCHRREPSGGAPSWVVSEETRLPWSCYPYGPRAPRRALEICEHSPFLHICTVPQNQRGGRHARCLTRRSAQVNSCHKSPNGAVYSHLRGTFETESLSGR